MRCSDITELSTAMLEVCLKCIDLTILMVRLFTERVFAPVYKFTHNTAYASIRKLNYHVIVSHQHTSTMAGNYCILQNHVTLTPCISLLLLS